MEHAIAPSYSARASNHPLLFDFLGGGPFQFFQGCQASFSLKYVNYFDSNSSYFI